MGLFTLLNSKQAKTPPGFRIRCASFNTSGILVQLRMPNAIVYKSYVLSGNCDISCAFASWNAT